MAKFQVISGIFKDYEFNGHSVTIAGESRVWDEDSAGRSYPSEHCIKLTECEECHNLAICESVLWYPNTENAIYLETCSECKVNFNVYIAE